jgi:hypothetical protein
MTPPASQVGLADNVLSSELRIYKEAREGDAKFKGTVTLNKEKYLILYGVSSISARTER